jgi:hypothetical protein
MLFNFAQFKHKHVERVFNVLVDAAYDMSTITYEEVCERLNINSKGHAIRFALGDVNALCLQLSLPPLNEICVRKGTGRPGSWAYNSADESAWRANVAAVYMTPWLSLLMPRKEE